MNDTGSNAIVDVVNPEGASSIVLACEHASAFIPAPLKNLGLSGEALTSHAAWDPGAMGVAEVLSAQLDAVLVASRISRLVYDCNRPPGHPDAMRPRSEIYVIPGNIGLSDADKQARHDTYYLPFHHAVTAAMAAKPAPLLVTMHSFTPVFHGEKREVEIGILHDTDSRMADAMLACADAHTQHIVRRNEPYGPVDGVTHTVAAHATPQRHPNVMLEVRNDLIQTPQAQADIAHQLAEWITQASAALAQDAACKA